MNRFSVRVLLTLLLPLAALGLARADINYSVSGLNARSLIVTITDDIHLTFNVGYTGSGVGILFENAVPPASGAMQSVFTSGPSTPLEGILPSVTQILQQYHGGGDLLFGYVFNEADITVAPGDVFTLPAGIYTVDHWFDLGGVLPSSPTTAVLVSKSGAPLSGPQAVPEPGAVALLAAGGMALLLRRRRSL